jgi:hypothetical protein
MRSDETRPDGMQDERHGVKFSIPWIFFHFKNYLQNKIEEAVAASQLS